MPAPLSLQCCQALESCRPVVRTFCCNPAPFVATTVHNSELVTPEFRTSTASIIRGHENSLCKKRDVVHSSHQYDHREPDVTDPSTLQARSFASESAYDMIQAVMESPKLHKFGLLGCFMVFPKRQALLSSSSSSSTSYSSGDNNFFSSDDPDIVPDAATAPLLDAEVKEESFVFSPLAAPTVHLESPSFRTLSDPLLSTFSYTVVPADTTRSKFGGRPHPLPLPGSPFRDFETAVKPAWLALPEASSEARSTSGASSCVSTSSSGEVGSWSVRREKVAVRVGAALPLPPPSVATKLLPGLEAFDFDDLARATRDFAPECCMEQGEFGAVYRAWLNNPGRELAVVRLNFDENQALKDWRTDVQTLSHLSDSNISSFKGYSTTPTHRLLVYTQSPNGTLHDYLSGTRAKTQLDWPARLSIVLGAARGLLYLHDRAPLNVLYRQFLSSSVLLDKDYTPRLAGYGIVVTKTPSKAAQQAHARRNVWSFGVVLVELLTGKHMEDKSSFVAWAIPFLKEESKLALVLDARMKGKCSMKGAVKVAELALRCLKRKEAQRPAMAKVVDTLRSIRENYGGRHSFGGVSFRDSESKAVDRKTWNFFLEEDEDSVTTSRSAHSRRVF